MTQKPEPGLQSSSDSRLSPHFQRSDADIERREVAFQGFFRLEKLTLKHKIFSGQWSNHFTREVFVRGNAVGVLLYDPHRDQILLIEQFRPGALYDESQSPWQFEIVAGMTEAGESSEDVVRREAMEEAGCTIEQLEFLMKYWVSPGGMDEQIELYCGMIDASQVREGVYGLDEENEDIRVELVSYAEAIQALQDGVINNAMAIIALQWLQLNRDRLRTQWCSAS